VIEKIEKITTKDDRSPLQASLTEHGDQVFETTEQLWMAAQRNFDAIVGQEASQA
jgi:hypothetical protein